MRTSANTVRRISLAVLCSVAPWWANADPRTNSAWSGHVSYVAGYKQLESKWEPVASQFEYGIIDADVQPPNWPFSLCGQLLLTYADDVPDLAGARGDYSGVWEMNLGVRKVWKASETWRPFLGGGFSLLGGSASTFVETPTGGMQDYEDSDYGAGAWVGGGLYWHFSPRWHTGVGLQYSWGEITLFDTKVNAGGFHAFAMFGYHW